jgi:hypothetical protein
MIKYDESARLALRRREADNLGEADRASTAHAQQR